MTTVNDNEYLGRLINSDIGKKFATEMLRESYESRQALIQDIESMHKAREPESIALGEAVEKAADRLETAKRQLEAAQAEHKDAQFEHGKARAAGNHSTAAFDARMGKLKKQLIDTAPQQINVFLEWLNDEESEARATKINSRGAMTGRKTVDGRYEKELYSDGDSLSRRLEAIRQARRVAQAMKLEAMTNDELELRLEELKHSIPKSVHMEKKGKACKRVARAW